MMIGYLNQPKSTYFDEDGFGMTGDLGYFNDHGQIFYVDRIKEIVKYEKFIENMIRANVCIG